jgi:hypothetical protein
MNVCGSRSAVDVVGGAGRISRRFDHRDDISVLGGLDLKAFMFWLEVRVVVVPIFSEFEILVQCRLRGLVGRLGGCPSEQIAELSEGLGGAEGVRISPEPDSGHFLFKTRFGSCVEGAS